MDHTYHIYGSIYAYGSFIGTDRRDYLYIISICGLRSIFLYMTSEEHCGMDKRINDHEHRDWYNIETEARYRERCV